MENDDWLLEAQKQQLEYAYRHLMELQTTLNFLRHLQIVVVEDGNLQEF